MTTQNNGGTLLYIGTYTVSEDDGIHVYRLDTGSGRLAPVSKIAGVVNPSFLAIHPGGSHLYSVAEVRESASGPGGAVSAFAIDPAPAG